MNTVLVLWLVLLYSVSSSGLSIQPVVSGSPPSNDQCQDALVMELGTVYSGSNSFSTVDFSAFSWNECIIPYYSGLVWYKVGGTGRKLTVSTDTEDDTVVWVFGSEFCQGSVLPFSTCVGANDDVAEADLSSSFTFCSSSDRDYLIAVGGYGNLDASFGIKVEDAGECTDLAVNNDCEEATLVPVAADVSVDISRGSVRPGSLIGYCGPQHDSYSAGRGLWYKVIGTGKLLSIEVVDKSIEMPILRVFRKDYHQSCKALSYPNTYPYANFPVCVTGVNESKWISSRDTEYLIYAEGYEAFEGTFVFRVVESFAECEKYNEVNLNFAGLEAQQ